MMVDIAIKANKVSKDFKLPHQKAGSLKSVFTNVFSLGSRSYEIQNALKDVSFEIKKGEFFGIVGRNGSGKSTLLKLLAGIYQPTKGSIQTKGKIVPFIELGVGFNPDLTGRENVYLNGALLGFKDNQIEKKYNQIVEFAELEKFMDQKLKNYSSGMQVRLAFSVATKLADPDILILDEVLAVGDEAFQRKCNDYFKQLKKDGRTVILVTHSMEAVQRFCDRAMLIHNGVVKSISSPGEIANQYTENNLIKSEKQSNSDHATGLSKRVPYFKITPTSKTVLSNEDELAFKVEYEIMDDTPVSIFFSIVDEKRGGSLLANGAQPVSGKGKHSLEYRFPIAYYNDADFFVNAVLDEAKSKKRIAFTNNDNSCRFALRNKESDNGLLRKDNDIHGYWVDWEERIYNVKEMQ